MRYQQNQNLITRILPYFMLCLIGWRLGVCMMDVLYSAGFWFIVARASFSTIQLGERGFAIRAWRLAAEGRPMERVPFVRWLGTHRWELPQVSQVRLTTPCAVFKSVVQRKANQIQKHALCASACHRENKITMLCLLDTILLQVRTSRNPKQCSVAVPFSPSMSPSVYAPKIDCAFVHSTIAIADPDESCFADIDVCIAGLQTSFSLCRRFWTCPKQGWYGLLDSWHSQRFKTISIPTQWY